MSDVFSQMKVFPLKKAHPTILGNGSVLVAGVVEVKFTIMKGPKGPFASLPARKGDQKDPETGKDKYYPDVRILDGELYKEFQKLALDAFNSGGKKTGQKASGEQNQWDDGVGF